MGGTSLGASTLQPTGEHPGQTGLKITALAVEDAAKILSAAAGRAISVAMIREDIEAGAPTNADNTINLVQYAAWLVGEVARRGD